MGFVVERLFEHQPVEEMAHRHPQAYVKLSREPGSVAFRIAKALRDG